jgi:hypothetical protein
MISDDEVVVVEEPNSLLERRDRSLARTQTRM